MSKKTKLTIDDTGLEWWLDNHDKYKNKGGYRRFIELADPKQFDWPDTVIAAEFGVSRATILNWRRHAGLTRVAVK